MKNTVVFNPIPVLLKKSTSQKVTLPNPVECLDDYTFKIIHNAPKPLTFRFTFYDEFENKSIYIALDIKSGDVFSFYSVTTDRMKTFTGLEIYCDSTVQLAITIELKSQQLE
ncbi:MAG TPA: hypothetical protein VFM99_02390, partial [Chitinophagales bacterium]|nr:hypothetical protein [Chitinophagales bacterium]